jgi:hypothetical protein
MIVNEFSAKWLMAHNVSHIRNAAAPLKKTIGGGIDVYAMLCLVNFFKSLLVSNDLKKLTCCKIQNCQKSPNFPSDLFSLKRENTDFY